MRQWKRREVAWVSGACGGEGDGGLTRGKVKVCWVRSAGVGKPSAQPTTAVESAEVSA